MPEGDDERSVIELRADADASSIAAELRSTDVRLGRLFAQYQLKVPERFGSKSGIAQSMIDFGADVLEAARRDGPGPAIALLEAELASLDMPVEGEDAGATKSNPRIGGTDYETDLAEQQLVPDASDVGLVTAAAATEKRTPTYVERLRGIVADPANAAMLAVLACAVVAAPYILSLKSNIFALEMKVTRAAFDTNVKALTAVRVGPHTFEDIKLIGEVYVLRDGDHPNYLLDIRDHGKIAAFYLCQQIEPPTSIVTKSGEALINSTDRPTAARGLQGTPVNHDAVTLHCGYHSAPDIKIGNVERPERIYPFTGDNTWGSSFSNDDNTYGPRRTPSFDLGTGQPLPPAKKP